MKVLVKILGTVGWNVLFDQAQGATIVMPEYKGSIRWSNFTSPGFGSISESVTPEGNARPIAPRIVSFRTG